MSTFERHIHYNKRLIPFYLIFGVISFFLGIGLAYRQLIEGPKYAEQERQQSLRRILKPGTRGNIYDRNGNLLVGSRAIFSVVIHLGELKKEFDKEYFSKVRILRKLQLSVDRRSVRKQTRAAVIQRYLDEVNQLLGRNAVLDEKELERHFSQRLLLPFSIVQNLNPEEYSKITEHFSPESPVEIFTDSVRYYPHGYAAAHVLGYVSSTQEISKENVEGNCLTTLAIKGKAGKSGLEMQFENLLQGTSGGRIWQVAPDGTTHQLVYEKHPTQGYDLYTTLDIELQKEAEKAFGDKKGVVIALEVETGEVLVMASKPSYDLNLLSPSISSDTYKKINDEGGWLNRAIQGVYPPGSPFKLISSIALLRHNTVDASTLSNCTGGYLVGKRLYPCMARYGHGPINLVDAIAHSCNVYYYEHCLQLNPNLLAEEACRFGLNQSTGIELPYESKRCLVPTTDWKKNKKLGKWMRGDTANMCIGQGYLLVTPLQIACFAASLARKETRTRPSILLDSTRIADSIYHQASPIGLSDDQWQLIIDGMEESTIKGTGKLVKIPNVSIASKTGTAEAPFKGRYINMAWYLGFAPIENPKIAVCVLVEGTEEYDHLYGGANAAPIAKSVFKKYFSENN